MTAKRSARSLDLFTISFLTLFFELLVICWIPTVIGPMAYFTNLTLILAFLGIGVGCLYARKPWNLFRTFLLSVLVLASAVVLLHRWRISFVDASVVFLNEPAFAQADAAALPPISIIVALGVLAPLVVFSFTCLGQDMGRRLKEFAPLTGYAINIAGSLAGVAAFGALAWLRCGPVTWFSVTGLSALWLLRSHVKQVWIGGLAIAAVLVIIGGASPRVFWSPYYRVQVHQFNNEVQHLAGLKASAL